ncbi:YqaJ viral recombinase family protein [Bradyrhizobium sp. SZCCHNS3053]|uniref:YqaJ viral recombinase family protein n=1 Tax=Bradyrhizobium sp. SZCCHNS3053 TaxID=3057322 RepID=UPI00291682AC|nr:YqaJ viral recombinase family protein [Bradyrhizobium sp. SZCCHNS3053]
MSEEARLARMNSIGGSDANIIMSGNQEKIERLWAEKRGEAQPEDMSEIILVNLGNLTEPLNADLFEDETELFVTDEQRKIHYYAWDKAHTTLDGLVRKTPDGDPIGIAEFKFMFPFGFSNEMAYEKYYAQVQHNMMVADVQKGWLSILTGAAQHVIIEVEADLFYQIALLEAEKEFWHCVETGKTPGVPVVEIPLIERVKVIDMSTNNEWCDLAFTLLSTKPAVAKHDKAKKAIKRLFPADAKNASGKGVTIKLSKDGKQLFEFDEEAIKQAAEQAANMPLAANDDTPEEKPEPKKRTPRKKAANSNDTAADEAA